MATAGLRVLLQHQDPDIHRRLRQVLLGEPDIELLESRTGTQPSDDLADTVRAFHPDIILADAIGETDAASSRLNDVIQASPVPARLVLLNGRHPHGQTHRMIDHVLSDTASRTEIIRAVRLVQTPSSYLRYLPSIFTRDDFMGRFLRIFEAVLEPIDQQIDGLDHYLDPDLTPDEFLPWLGSWLDVTLDEGWPRERKVALIRAAPALHRWRGTRRGLTEHLRLYLGVTPEIEETAGGLRLSPSTQLGFRTVMGESGPRHHFTVTLRVPDPSAVDYTHVAALIDAQKPAHCSYTLTILPGGIVESDSLADTADPTAEAVTSQERANEMHSPEDV